MLKEFVEKKHYIFIDEADSWQSAIRIGCKPLEEDGTVDKTYAEEIIECVTKYGPYIIIMPDIAMPHSQEGAVGVNKTAVSFMKVNKPVSFEKDDPEMEARLFFTLASCNHEIHLENMQKLCEMLMIEELVEELLKVTSPEELLELHKKYLKE